MIKDHLLTTEYGVPIEVEEGPAIITLIIRLLLLEPGKNQSHPEMGVGILTQYRYAYAEDIKRLENNIVEQINTYLPMLSDVEVKLEYLQTTLYIRLEITRLIISMNVTNNILAIQDIKQK